VCAYDYVCTVASIPNFLKLPEKSGYCVIIENGIISLLPFGGGLFLLLRFLNRWFAKALLKTFSEA